MISVLSIANSFGQDTHRYLRGLAKNQGIDLTCVNLYIGGCSLWRHFKNLQQDAAEYSMEYNGESTGFFTDIKTALLSRRWDFVTLQQASHESPWFEKNYEPYLTVLAEAVRKYAPQAKLVIHQTWAYAETSPRLHEELGYAERHDMLRDVVASYDKAAASVNADLMIPAGKAMMALEDMGLRAHRDGFHASLGAGRYAVGLTWLGALTGADVTQNSFCDFDVPVSPEEAAAARQAAAIALGE